MSLRAAKVLANIVRSDASNAPFSGSVIGNITDPNAATTKQFQEFWRELARRFVFNPKVIFGINNEPHDMVRYVFSCVPLAHS